MASTLLFGLALACAHSDPAGPADIPASDGPLAATAPTRLTYDPGLDQLSGISPDGATILYSFQPFGRADRDRCLALLPASGGTRQEYCENAVAHQALTDALEMPALGTDGALLYAAYESAIGAPLPARGALRLATRSEPGTTRTLLTLPTTIGPFGFDHVGTIRWTSPTTFYFVAANFLLTGSPLGTTDRDTLIAGVGLVRGELTATGATFSDVPGSDSVSDFDFSANGDSLYITRRDDPSLYAIPIAGGVRRVLYTEPRLADSATVVNHPVRVPGGIVVVREMYQDLASLVPPKGNLPVPPALGLMPRSALRVIHGDGSSTLLVTAPTARPAAGSGSLAAFGRLAATGNRLVVEHRFPIDASFTTDFFGYCAQGNGC